MNSASFPPGRELASSAAKAVAARTLAPLVSVRGLTKRYPLYRNPAERLGHAIFGPRIVRIPEFTALDGVGFELHPGDALAVMGRNGAGKSTLLQILAGISRATSGTFEVPGRTVGLLELGSGFNPEFTGRENVFLNAAILGLRRREIEERLGDILAFAEIGDFIDRPVKTYSTGMFLRLAFSVAIHVEPTLLLVDEALTVGDVFFQQKCYRRLETLRARGMSLLLVTHSTIDAAEFCNRGIVLSNSRLVFDGSGKEAVEYYLHHEFQDARAVDAAPPRRPAMRPSQGEGDIEAGWTSLEATVDLSPRTQIGTQGVRATRFRVTDENGSPHRAFEQGQTLRILAEFTSSVPMGVPLFGVQLLNPKGIMVHGKSSLQFDLPLPDALPAGATVQFEQRIELNIDVGEYTIEIGLADIDPRTYALRGRLLPAELFAGVRRLCHVPQVSAISVHHPDQGYPCRSSHFGVSDLPGEQRVQYRIGAPEAALAAEPPPGGSPGC